MILFVEYFNQDLCVQFQVSQTYCYLLSDIYFYSSISDKVIHNTAL